MPAKDDDKFNNNNKCVQCWYTENHPGVKISPCGHVFGCDCLKDIVNGPNLCPYCRVKLFRHMPTTQDILESILESIVLAMLHGFLAYYDTVAWLTTNLYAFVSNKSNWYSIFCPMAALVFLGLANRVEIVVRNYTGVYARNLTLDLFRNLDGRSQHCAHRQSRCCDVFVHHVCWLLHHARHPREVL